jgi:molybdenum cofactor guanylyltransferase
MKITAVILAGGQGRRFNNADKGLIHVNNKPIIELVLAAIETQCSNILINANRNIDIYESYNYPVISDTLNDFQGPLAGFYVALIHSKTSHLITLPCDAPRVPKDFVERMTCTLQESKADIAVAHDGERLQPVYALLKTSLAESLHDFLNTGQRKIDRWYATQQVVEVDFSDVRDDFKNINTMKQQQQIQHGL